MKNKPCNHQGNIFKKLDCYGVMEYKKYVGKLKKCGKCKKYVGYKSLQKKNKSIEIEKVISELINNL